MFKMSRAAANGMAGGWASSPVYGQKRSNSSIDNPAVVASPGWKRQKLNPWEAAIVISDDEGGENELEIIGGDENTEAFTDEKYSVMKHEPGPSSVAVKREQQEILRQRSAQRAPASPPVFTPPLSNPGRSTHWEAPPGTDQPTPTRVSHDGVFDHRGRPLSDDALEIAREYWESQREFELCPFDADDEVQGPQPLADPLLRAARYRREYTRLILGLEYLPPCIRTYEPPYIVPAPVIHTADVPAPVAPVTQPTLSEEQAKIVDLAASGKNIFYTGSAGCGKSTVLHVIKESLEALGKNVHVMAPTGKVALAINGTTTWTYAGWNPDAYKRPLKQLEATARGRTTRKRFKRTDTIIIDEISMVENLHFERMNAVMKAGRDSDEPFGGVQVIVTGDFCQLPPVKPFTHCMTCGLEFKVALFSGEPTYSCPKCCHHPYKDSDKWAFRSGAWEECNFEHILLKAIHRQHDLQFVSLLQKCRMGVPFAPWEINLLMNHPTKTANAVKLFSTRDEVRRTNRQAYDRLRTPEHRYRCYDDFFWQDNIHPHLASKRTRNTDGSLAALNDHRFEPNIQLKQGMLVVLLVNLDLTQGLCNGSQGVIAGFEPYDPNKLPRRSTAGDNRTEREGGLVSAHSAVKEDHIRLFSEQQKDGLGWPVVKFHNGVTRVVYPECQVNELGDVEPYSLLCRTQVPLTAAWALSIHKSQGMTLDRVVVDLSRTFEEGQVYVALSRATSLEGLKIQGDSKSWMKVMGMNREVQEFLWQKFGDM